MILKRDYFEVLGVSRNADAATIKKAYSKLAKKYHPDLNPDDPHATEKMNEVNAAYDAIKYGNANSYGATGGYGQAGGYGAYGGWGAQRAPGIRPEYQAAVNFIQPRHFAEALEQLEEDPLIVELHQAVAALLLGRDRRGERAVAERYLRTGVHFASRLF